MQRIAGTIFGLLFLLWGVLTAIGGADEGRADWVVIGIVIGAFGCLFLPAIRYLWQRDELTRSRERPAPER
jgi:hypothetical protein